MTPIVTLTIPGRVAILKNRKRIVARRGRVFVLPSEKYAEWEKEAMLALKRSFTGHLIDYPVELHARFYFTNRQGEGDLSNMVQGPEDVLQKVGILKDDKLICKSVTEKFYGHEPRVEIEIYKYQNPTQGEVKNVSGL